MNFIDVHCHLDGGHYGADLFENIKKAGVKKFIAVGVDLQTSLFGKDLSEMPQCYFTAGFHPTELKDCKQEYLDKIEELALDKKCVAIGEIGLDYHYPDTDKPLQRRVFEAQLTLAEKLNLPVQIHSRDSAEDMVAILRERAGGLKIMLHCYSHSVEIAEELAKLGVYFSFGGTSTYQGSKKARRTIAALPLDRILTETDSPYLPPKSKQGLFPNTPESIPEIAANIAVIKGLSLEEVARSVWNTAHTLFDKLN